jgi:hypothetical protein
MSSGSGSSGRPSSGHKITLPTTMPFMQSLKTTFDIVLSKPTKAEALEVWKNAFKVRSWMTGVCDPLDGFLINGL